MKATITIETGNAAFSDYPEFEIARILRKLADRIEDRGIEDTSICDINGGRVGGLVCDQDATDNDSETDF